MVPILEANAKRRQYDTFDDVVKGIHQCWGTGLAIDWVEALSKDNSTSLRLVLAIRCLTGLSDFKHAALRIDKATVIRIQDQTAYPSNNPTARERRLWRGGVDLARVGRRTPLAQERRISNNSACERDGLG